MGEDHVYPGLTRQEKWKYGSLAGGMLFFLVICVWGGIENSKMPRYSPPKDTYSPLPMTGNQRAAIVERLRLEGMSESEAYRAADTIDAARMDAQRRKARP